MAGMFQAVAARQQAARDHAKPKAVPKPGPMRKPAAILKRPSSSARQPGQPEGQPEPASAGPDRSRSPKRVAEPGPSVALDNVEKIFDITGQFVDKLKQEYGAECVEDALDRLERFVFTSSFSGCGFAELGVESLAGVGGKSVAFGCAVEWNQECRKILRARHPQRCIFNDVMDLTSSFRANQNRPSCKVPKECWCETHQQRCSTRPQGDQPTFELAGPPCPPWSNFSNNKKGTSDARYRFHQAWRDMGGFV